MNRPFAVFLSLVLWLSCLGAAGAQQIDNPGFDADLQHWTDPQYPDRQLSWSSEDSADSLSSGSLLHVGDDTSGGIGLGLEQCVDVQPGATYTVGGEAYVPSGQAASIAPYIFLEEYNGDDCDAYTGRSWFTGPFTAVGSWGTFDVLEALVLPTTESVKVVLGAWVEAAGVDLDAHFDDIVFGLAGPPPIFVDGFESGSTSAWSSVSP